MTDTPKRPEDTLRDGSLKATIWRNESENGPYLNTVLSKAYKDQDGNWRETDRLGQNDRLRVSELARAAYHRNAELRREITHENTGQARGNTPAPQHSPERESRRAAFNTRRARQDTQPTRMHPRDPCR